MQYTDLYTRTTSPTFPITNKYIDQHDAGLSGVQGAEAIVKLLRMHRSIQHLILGHNALGDSGCVALFDYLRSEEGKKHKLLEISLNANNIGDVGLWAIARYLEYNESLSALFLQNNILKGDRPIMLRFVHAINRSNLRTLSLTCNKSLGDAIPTTFLSHLSAPRLSELHLSVCSIGPSATPALLSYLTSPRSAGLYTLKLNGNPLGLSSVTRIIHALERGNWSVGWVEMHACCLNGVPEGDNGWRKCEEQLRMKVLERNRFLGKKAAEDALLLLPHARPALLPSGRQVTGPRPRLPTEIVMHILSFLAPALSAAQHIRVCLYAASASSLPSLEFTIPSCHSPFQSPSYPELQSSTRHLLVIDALGRGTLSPALRRPVSAQMTSLARSEERKTWLRKVGCDRFEPDTHEVDLDVELTQDELYQNGEEVATIL